MAFLRADWAWILRLGVRLSTGVLILTPERCDRYPVARISPESEAERN